MRAHVTRTDAGQSFSRKDIVMQTRSCRINLSIAVLALAGIALVGRVASAQVPNPLITVDENGNGTIQFSGSLPSNLPGFLAADPGPGGLASALTYNLQNPPSLVAGDVFMLEPASANGAFSEVIRFNPANAATGYPASLVFYSDNFDGVDAIADTGFPLSFYANTVTINEVGSEGNNGAFYTPTANQPGFVTGLTVTYHFISDASVPEPGSVALLTGLLVPGSVLVFRRIRRSNK